MKIKLIISYLMKYMIHSYNFKLWLNGNLNEIAKINNCYRQQIKREIESEIKRIRERLGINESSD